MNNLSIHFKLLFLIFFLTLFVSCTNKDDYKLSSDEITFEVNDRLFTRINSADKSLEIGKSFEPSEFIIIGQDTLKEFHLISSEKINNEDLTKLVVTGELKNEKYNILKSAVFTFNKSFPKLISVKVNYKNNGNSDLKISEWVNNAYTFSVSDSSEIVWSFQGASYPERPDWVLKVPNNFHQENFMGMNASDYGGGTPVVDIWNKNIGIGIGLLELVPKLVSLPVSRDNNIVKVNVNDKKEILLKPNESFVTFETFISMHKKDYFETLSNYSSLLQKRGLKFKEIDDAAYEPIWCAWGYERNFKVQDVLNTLPKVKELGLKWAVLDDGWQTSEGDWYLNPKKFPNGDSDMINFVDRIHQQGLKAKLWWAPLAVDPETDLFKNQKDLLLVNKEGNYQDITWWDSYYLCPAYQGTIDYTNNLVKKFISDWGYDGLKIDGQHLNAAPPCYNPLHNHKYPEESVEAMPQFYDEIYKTVININKQAVVEICPCGDSYSFFMLPNINQTVSSDPISSWQIRTKGKSIKAMMGARAPYYGDHVELSSTREDFASTVGIGGVVGTKFTYPVGIYINTESGDVSLTPEREKKWKKWISIYNTNMLSKGDYIGNLYDIGFDRPETHVVQKDDTMFYSFYADTFNGKIELRGLDRSKEYLVYDYVNNNEMGEIKGNDPHFNTEFNDYLLVKVTPIN